LETDRQADEQMDSTDALSHSHFREQRLNKLVCIINTKTLLN